MTYEMIDALVGGLILLAQGVTVAIIAGLFNRENKKRANDTAAIEKRSARRTEESRLAMRLMSANTSLAVATGLALKEGKSNGKMDFALTEAQKAQSNYFRFVDGVASEQIAE